MIALDEHEEIIKLEELNAALSQKRRDLTCNQNYSRFQNYTSLFCEYTETQLNERKCCICLTTACSQNYRPQCNQP